MCYTDAEWLAEAAEEEAEETDEEPFEVEADRPTAKA